MRYIGKHHGRIDDNYLGSGSKLKEAIKQFGKENFKKDILYISQTEEENCQKEKEFIATFDAVNSPLFYNIHEGGIGGNTTAGYSFEDKEKLSKKFSELRKGEKNGMYGKHHTEESKKKMSENSKGKTSGEKNGMYGKSGNNALNGKKIAMYDKNMKLIQVFNAKTAVLAFLQMKGHVGLNKAIKEGTLYKGYYWKNY